MNNVTKIDKDIMTGIINCMEHGYIICRFIQQISIRSRLTLKISITIDGNKEMIWNYFSLE